MDFNLLELFLLIKIWSQYLLASILLFILLQYFIKWLLFVGGLSAIPGPQGIPILGNSLSLTGGQEGESELFLHLSFRKK